MSRIARPRSLQPDIPVQERDRTGAVGRNTESTWPEPPLPDDPTEQRRVQNRLIVFALTLPVARLLSFLFR